jgi:hypothetical protein
MGWRIGAVDPGTQWAVDWFVDPGTQWVSEQVLWTLLQYLMGQLLALWILLSNWQLVSG